jgi:hypothetical protein
MSAPDGELDISTRPVVAGRRVVIADGVVGRGCEVAVEVRSGVEKEVAPGVADPEGTTGEVGRVAPDV